MSDKLSEDELLKRAEERVKNGEWILKRCSNVKEWQKELEIDKAIVALIKKPEVTKKWIEEKYISVVVDLNKQIEAKKPQVTEEWIDEKAKEFIVKANVAIQNPEAYKQQLGVIKDFLRSFAEEIIKK